MKLRKSQPRKNVIMPKIEDLTLSDNTGEEYTFEVYPKGTELKSVAGVYAFTKRTANQHGAQHTILYIGQTESFEDRPLNYNHEKWFSAKEMGFTHICVLQIENRDWIQNTRIRLSIEKRLIVAYNPPLNERVG